MASVIAQVAAGWLELLVANSLLVVVVFAAVAVLARLTRKVAAGLGVALWSLVFARLVLPPGFSHPLAAVGLAERWVEAGSTVAVTGLAAATGGAGFEGDLAAASLGGGPAAAWWPLVAAAGWLAGALVVLIRYRTRLREYRLVVERADPLRSPEALALVARWRSALRVRRSVRVVASETGCGPFTLGVVRPVIYLPASVLEDPSSLEPAVAHEMVHVARLDAMWLFLQHCLQAVYFFHPLVWVSGARLTEERERLADATVLAAGGLRTRDYALGLLRVARLQLATGAAPSMSATSRRFRMRVHDIISTSTSLRPRMAVSLSIMVVTAVLLLPLGTSGAEESTPQPAASSASAAPQPGAGVQLSNPLPDGRITARWGGMKDPWKGDDVFHKGIDVAAAAGTPVVAPAPGVVVVATENFEPSPASGTVVIVDHGGGLQTMYAHLGSLEVADGDSVARGQLLARVGSTGKSTGPHLHFEVRMNGEPQDPADYVMDWR